MGDHSREGAEVSDGPGGWRSVPAKTWISTAIGCVVLVGLVGMLVVPIISIGTVVWGIIQAFIGAPVVATGIVAFLAVTTAAIVFFDRHRRQVRESALREWAASVGWWYAGSNDALARRWHCDPFAGVDLKRVDELMFGVFAGRQVATFRYFATISVRRRNDPRRRWGLSTSCFHVITMGLPASLPGLELVPEDARGYSARSSRGHDIRFGFEDFDVAWRVRSDDVEFANAIMCRPLMERLLQDDARGLQLRVEGADLLCWSLGSPKLAAITPRLRVMSAVVDAVPQGVWEAYGHSPDDVQDTQDVQDEAPPDADESVPRNGRNV